MASQPGSNSTGNVVEVSWGRGGVGGLRTLDAFVLLPVPWDDDRDFPPMVGLYTVMRDRFISKLE